ncbi:hypothetical protein KFE25_012436 [Diacronema lutheri]|uniref:Uncharacterized protein n=1 Tax=Diacronema lutheri TaxID=2081491 RepID=A0A8J5XIH1_DIALT|nr:hypothetical protein KFE25_012436 [Diacronema lutheri]
MVAALSGLSALWVEAVGDVVQRGGLAPADASALLTSAQALWADASARVELATRDSAIADLDAQLAALSAQLAAKRSDVPSAVREHIAAEHRAHLVELEACAQRARAAEHHPLPAPPACDAACVAQLHRVAERHGRVVAALEMAATDATAHAARERQLVAHLDEVVALEARPCSTQDMLGAPGAKGLAAGQRAAQSRVLARMAHQLAA